MKTKTFISVSGLDLTRKLTFIVCYNLSEDKALAWAKESYVWLQDLQCEIIAERDIYTVSARVLDDMHGNYAISHGPTWNKGTHVNDGWYSRMFASKAEAKAFYNSIKKMGEWK